jgi:hypothetical protein
VPIFAGAVVPAPPPTPSPTPSPPAPPVVIPEVGYASVTYIDPHGVAWPMTDASAQVYALADGVSGLGAAPVTLTTDPLPRGGVRLRHVQPQARTIIWPVHVEGETHQEFIDLWRAMGKAFTDTLRYGPGILDIARPDGRRRQIKVVYQDGWDGLGQAGTGNSWDKAVVTLLAQDPYFYDPEPVVIVRTFGGAGDSADFLSPYPSVSNSQVLGATTLTNPGDIIAWPTWTINGPASLATITNSDTGAAFAVDPNAAAIAHGNLLAGEYVTVITDPPAVRFGNGDVWTGSLNWPSAALWGLDPGDTDVSFVLAGAADGSAVVCSFNPRYEMA